MTVHKEDGHTPPQAVRSAAARGLELRREYGRGGTATGIARARDLSNGTAVSTSTIRRMKAFFDRHQGNKDTPPEEGNGKIAWLLWGGDAGRRWAEGIINRMESEAKKGIDEELGEDFDDVDDVKRTFEVVKVDSQLGLVFGFAIVCKVDGQDYFDVQGDHIPEQSMLEASLDFMENSQVAKEMHQGEQKGSVVFAFPLTSDIAKSMGIQAQKTGLMIAMKPASDEMLQKFKTGEYTGFSIGGRRIQDEEVAE